MRTQNMIMRTNGCRLALILYYDNFSSVLIFQCRTENYLITDELFSWSLKDLKTWMEYCEHFLPICLLARSSQKLSRPALKSVMLLCKHSIFELIIVEHVVEGIAELIRNLLDLELFPVNLVLNIINPEVKENIKPCYSKTLKHERKGPC